MFSSLQTQEKQNGVDSSTSSPFINSQRSTIPRLHTNRILEWSLGGLGLAPSTISLTTRSSIAQSNRCSGNCGAFDSSLNITQMGSSGGDLTSPTFFDIVGTKFAEVKRRWPGVGSALSLLCPSLSPATLNCLCDACGKRFDSSPFYYKTGEGSLLETLVETLKTNCLIAPRYAGEGAQTFLGRGVHLLLTYAINSSKDYLTQGNIRNLALSMGIERL